MRLLVTWKQMSEQDLKLIEKRTGATVLNAESKEQAVQLAKEADVIFGFASSDVLAAATECRWLQTPFAGAETILAADWGNPEMYYSNGSGIFGPPIGEHIVGIILAFNRGLHLARDNQKQQKWDMLPDYSFRELTNSTVGILGFGDLGRNAAQRLSGFGCEIFAFRQHPTGNEPYAAHVYQLEQFNEVAARLDYVVGTLPHTEQTSGFLHKDRLRLLSPHAIVINVGRGSLIPAADLVLALEKGWIAGAGLDVTDPEPLDEQSPLWSMDNVIITPHNSASTPYHKERALEIFLTNWEHFVQTGKPRLNLVDSKLGY